MEGAMFQSDRITLRIATHESALQQALEIWLESLAAKGCSANTIACYRYYLQPFIDFLAQCCGVKDLDDAKPQHIRRWLIYRRQQGLSEKTVHNSFAFPAVFWRWCLREGLTENNPFATLEKPKVPPKLKPALTPEQVEQILHACEGKHWLRLRDKALVLLLLDTGLRIHEAHSLKVGDIHQDCVVIRGKGGKQRFVFLSPEVRIAVKRYLKACPYRLDESSPLWHGAKGALTLNGLKNAVKAIGKRAGITPLGAHAFRRTFATWSLRNGIDLEHLRQLMGHSDYSVLRQYLALVEQDLKQAHAQHSPLRNLRFCKP